MPASDRPVVLICTVGGSPAPVIHAIAQNRPVRSYLVCSDGEGPASSATTVRSESVRVTRWRCAACGRETDKRHVEPAIASAANLAAEAFEIVAVNDPDDLPQILTACEGIDADIRRRFGDSARDVVANYTGGTKTMALGLGLHALRRGYRLQVQAGGRPDLVGITGGDVAIGQDVARIEARQGAELIRATIERGDYEGAVTIATETLVRCGHEGAARAELFPLRSRAAMLAAWDRFDYDKALDIGATLWTDRDGAQEKTRLSRLRAARKAWLDQGQTGRAAPAAMSYDLVRDLVQNARRCAARRRFDDAVGRLYRAVELLAQVRLRSTHGIDTAAVPTDHPALTAETRPLVAEVAEDGPAKLGLFRAYQLLAAIQDPLGRHFIEAEKRFRRALEIRNQSLFAHGLRPIDGEDWREVGEFWLEWLEAGLKAIEA